MSSHESNHFSARSRPEAAGRLHEHHGELVDEGSLLGSVSDTLTSDTSNLSSSESISSSDFTGSSSSAEGSTIGESRTPSLPGTLLHHDGNAVSDTSEDTTEGDDMSSVDSDALTQSSRSSSSKISQPARRARKRARQISSEDGTSDEELPSNTWTGSQWQWRQYTQNERAVWEGLMQDRGQDLSVHLYNVYAAQQRSSIHEGAIAEQPRPVDARESEIEQGRDESHQGVGPSKRKQRRVLRQKDGSWIPRKWTSWPLPLQTFPASDTRDDENYVSSGAKARDELEDILLGSLLRKIRARLTRREWIKEEVQEMEPNGDKMGGRPNHQQKAERPSMMIDDDYARALLLPSIRGLLGRLDKLLDDLHTQQRSLLRNPALQSQSASSRTRSRDEHEEVETPVSKTGASPTRTSLNEEISQVPKRQRRSANPSLPLRTWTSILSLAALRRPSNLPLSSILTATSRCESLFDVSLDTSHPLTILLSPSSPDSSASSSSNPSRPTSSHQTSLLLGRNSSTRGRHHNPHLIISEAVAERLRGTMWTEEEDRILGEGVEAGMSFGEIVEGSAVLRGARRTKNACKGRWRTIGIVRERALRGVGMREGDGGGEVEMMGGIRRDGFLQPVLL